MATNAEIKEWFCTLQLKVQELSGAELQDKERQQVQMLAAAGLNILEALVTAINNIAAKP